ncbi:hypothetical protein MMC21_002678 [Puttea exsequens]|nr:hypothetical protein [Puttea exsequens]
MADELPNGYESGGMSPIHAGSHRSRASSVMSTGTKFSISTIPQPGYRSDGSDENENHTGHRTSNSLSRHDRGASNAPDRALSEARNAHLAATRPSSIHSFRSSAPSLPPYEGHEPPELHHETMPDHEDGPEQPVSPLDSENALSRHYGRIVRTIDENHARQLERIYRGHSQEVAELRESIDKAYRQEFKVKDREIERVREQCAKEISAVEGEKDRELLRVSQESAARAARLEGQITALEVSHDDTIARMQREHEIKEREHSQKIAEMQVAHEKATEKACHAVEDVWETRWFDYSRLSDDEARSRDLKRDNHWLTFLSAHHPGIVDEAMRVMKITRSEKGALQPMD